MISSLTIKEFYVLREKLITSLTTSPEIIMWGDVMILFSGKKCVDYGIDYKVWRRTECDR